MKEFVQFPGAPDNNQSVNPSPILFSDPQSSILGPMPNILPLGSVTPDPVNPVNQSNSIPVQPPPHFGGSESLPLVPTHPPPLQQPAPRSNGIGTWPSNNTHVPVPSSGTLGTGCIPISNHQEEVPTVTCNVPLPHDFDVVTLFPDNHPQVSLMYICTLYMYISKPLWLFQNFHSIDPKFSEHFVAAFKFLSHCGC